MKIIKKCEICGNHKLIPVLDLGEQPLCDDLLPIGSKEVCKEYPIKILYCKNCYSAHQQYQVEKETLFPKEYHYRSRFTKDVLNGMQDFVYSCKEKLGSLEGKTIVDIGCNDGSLLDYFRMGGGITIGVEPTDACLDAQEKGHEVYQRYFDLEIAKEIRRKHEQIDIITFTNVFAHIDDLQNLLKAVEILSNDNTLLVIENHYLGDILKKHQFDTFYHEHPRTYSLKSFETIAHFIGKEVLDVEFPQRYGGNIRVYIGKIKLKLGEICIDDILERESHYFEQFKELENFIIAWRQSKLAELKDYIDKYGRMRAKAFPGRAAILVKLLGLDTEHILTVYEKPGSMKIGYYVPGTRIEIHSDEELFLVEDKTQPILNLAWHISKEIRGYLQEKGFEGEVIDIV